MLLMSSRWVYVTIASLVLFMQKKKQMLPAAENRL